MDFEIFNERTISIPLVFHVQQCQHVSNVNPRAELPKRARPRALSQYLKLSFLLSSAASGQSPSDTATGVDMKPPQKLMH